MKSKKKKLIAPIAVTVFLILYYALYFCIFLPLLSGVLRVFCAVVPLLLGALTVKVCVERVKEILKGEEDDLSQY